jgi:hypothetical protein
MNTFIVYMYESEAHKKALLADVKLLDKCKILKLHCENKQKALDLALELMEDFEPNEQHLKIYAIVEEKGE